MHKLVRVGLCVGLLSCGFHAPAVAQQPTAAKADPAALGIDDTKVICKNWRESTSRIPAKKCLTKRQWNLMEENARKGARDMIERPIINTNRG